VGWWRRCPVACPCLKDDAATRSVTLRSSSSTAGWACRMTPTGRARVGRGQDQGMVAAPSLATSCRARPWSLSGLATTDSATVTPRRWIGSCGQPERPDQHLSYPPPERGNHPTCNARRSGRRPRRSRWSLRVPIGPGQRPHRRSESGICPRPSRAACSQCGRSLSPRRPAPGGRRAGRHGQVRHRLQDLVGVYARERAHDRPRPTTELRQLNPLTNYVVAR
jgi:hypothetical protein